MISITKIPLKNGNILTVDVFNCHGNNDEVIVGIENQDGNYIQDLVCIRESDTQDNIIGMLVWTNEQSEDFTHEFKIPIYKE